jgi:hypothetical protein
MPTSVESSVRCARTSLDQNLRDRQLMLGKPPVVYVAERLSELWYDCSNRVGKKGIHVKTISQTTTHTTQETAEARTTHGESSKLALQIVVRTLVRARENRGTCWMNLCAREKIAISDPG